MKDIRNRIVLTRRLAGRIQGFFADLPEEALCRPSACDLWEVRDVLGHLIGGAERQIDSVRRGLQGDASPAPGFVPMDAATLSSTNAQRDIERRERLGNQLLPAFAARYQELGELLGGLAPEDWAASCWHPRRGVMTAREYLDLRIQELAIHDWDIRSAFEPEAGLDPESLPVLLDIAPAWLRMTFRPGTKLDKPVVFRFDLKGAAGRRHDVVVQGDEFQVVRAGKARAGVSLGCDSGSYLLYVYGRLSAGGAAASDRLAVEGDVSLLRKFEEWFKGL
ncbi:MAG: maleylpyruvate isomerase family mycothiol-dependent enzyme [Chloroflexota bacterium]